MKREYDSTVARIAGNIASGLASSSPEALADWALPGDTSLAEIAVRMARQIVAETKRTEPKEQP